MPIKHANEPCSQSSCRFNTAKPKDALETELAVVRIMFHPVSIRRHGRESD